MTDEAGGVARLAVGIQRGGFGRVTNNIMGNTICAFADGAAMPMLGFLLRFREEFEQHAREKKCPFGKRWH